MKPDSLHTTIFLDSGDPMETKKILTILGFLDGQTTNPSLIAKSPGAKERLQKGEKFTQAEMLEYYKRTVSDIRSILPSGSVSVEVYADLTTTAEEMISQAQEMNTWIEGAHIKLPTTTEGLKAAHQLVGDGLNVNMTLVFSQEQAAAVYAATKGAKRGQVFLSPFIGRLDDIGLNGMDLIKNIITMYKESSDGHVQVLTASVRSLDHFKATLALGSDIITAPAALITEWAEQGMAIPSEYTYARKDLEQIQYQDISLEQPFGLYNVQHELTDKGLEKFAADWNNLISQ